MRLRVLVVSDVRVVREGVDSVLAHHEELDVVSSADVGHAREQSLSHQPDLVLLDAARQDSLSFVRELMRTAPHLKVVAFGVKETDQELVALAAAGTAGYVRDCAASDDLVSVLQRVMRDELPCSAHAAASLFRQVAALAQATPGGADADACRLLLSRRELQIARLIERGLTNKQIARQLGIEPATVKNHVHNLCDKLQVHRRGEVAARLRVLPRPRATAPEGQPASTPATPQL
jgi:DNA-binding NarL/FixJ family response regulator